MRKTSTYILLGTLALALAAPNTGWAKKEKEKHNHDENTESFVEIGNDDFKIVIGSDDRRTIKHHIREHAFAHCPPGLAKKNPPCVPPGQAKKYQIGHKLETGYKLIPDSWGLRAPKGYQYVQVDQDVLLIAEASKKVIDAVTLLSAVD